MSLFLMFLMHIIDDFGLQVKSLSYLKQKKWWENECAKLNIDVSKYKNDYIVALILHSLSWSIMIILPMYFLTSVMDNILISLILFNTIIHAYVDNLKANKYKINLIVDQIIHIIQIILTYLIIVYYEN